MVPDLLVNLPFHLPTKITSNEGREQTQMMEEGAKLVEEVGSGFCTIKWCHDTQHNETQHDDIQHDDTQHKGLIIDNQHNNTLP